MELFCSLAAARVTLCPRETAMDPVKLYHFIERQQPSVIQATPTVWSTIVHHLPAAGQRLTVLCGGEDAGDAMTQFATHRGAGAAGVWPANRHLVDLRRSDSRRRERLYRHADTVD
ncbi:hypothetical protein M8494_20235 [Serratia ureilytica]